MDSVKVKNTKNYQNGKIYCIRNNITEDYYIGSTCQSLSQRMAQHRGDMKKQNRQNTLIYPFMIKHGYENCYIELIEECPCENKSRLQKREGEKIREWKPTLNIKVPGRTEQEFKQDNPEYFKQQKARDNKAYREKYQEQIKAGKRLEYLRNAEKYKERARIYKEEHREEINRKSREKYHKQKEQQNINSSDNGDKETQETVKQIMKN